MRMENQVSLGLVDYYYEKKDIVPLINQELVKTFVYYLVCQIYSYYILCFPRYLKESELLEYDKSLLKKSPFFYDMAAKAKDVRKFGTFFYVKDFREKKTRKTLRYFYYDCCMKVGELLTKFKVGL